MTNFPNTGKQNMWNQPFAQKFQKQNPYGGFSPQMQRQGQRTFNRGMGLYGRGSQLLGQGAGRANQMLGQLMPMLGGGAASWQNKFGFPQAGDPNVMAHLGHLQSGMKSNMADYARMARPMNLRGMGVAGGVNPAAQMHQQAMGQIARDYSKAYDQAMGYGMQGAQFGLDAMQTGYGLAGDALKALMGGAGTAFGAGSDLLGHSRGFAGMDLQGRQVADARNRDLFGMQRQDYMDDLAWQRNQWDRDFRRKKLLADYLASASHKNWEREQQRSILEQRRDLMDRNFLERPYGWDPSGTRGINEWLIASGTARPPAWTLEQAGKLGFQPTF